MYTPCLIRRNAAKNNYELHYDRFKSEVPKAVHCGTLVVYQMMGINDIFAELGWYYGMLFVSPCIYRVIFHSSVINPQKLQISTYGFSRNLHIS